MGDLSIKSSEYLYNLDDSPDFIYVEFEGSGYAVYSSRTLDVLEYSLSGTLPYSQQAIKYYAGPTGYYNKIGQNLENIITEESIAIVDAAVAARQVRNVLEQANIASGQAKKSNFDYSIGMSAGNKSEDIDLSSSGGTTISGGGLGPNATYIPNVEYFLLNPTHGYNSTGTCSAVIVKNTI